jgi:hypothetical protein
MASSAPTIPAEEPTVADIANSLTTAFDHVWGRFLGRLDGLGDEEYLWEPVPDCWSVRQDDDGRWRIDGDGGDGGPASAPDPAPVTTIAWRIGHIGLTFIGFGDRLFADGSRTLEDVRIASSPAEARMFLQTSYREWREGLDTLEEDRWWRPIGPKFGPYAPQPTTDLALHVLDELIHHAAEVGVLRDLYLRRGRLGAH